jgi:type IV pilus assembly protein PilC
MKYQYRAIKQGQIVKGDIEAKNKEKAIEVLKSNKIVILDVKPKKNPIFSSDALFNRVSFNEIVNLTRHFSIMLNAGLTITDSIDIIKKQSESKGMEKLINMIEDEIRSGNSLSTALEAHTNYFSNFYIALVRAGEASGKLDNVLDKLAHNLEKQREFKGKITGALIYPAVIVVVMFAVIFIMITFVIPNLLNVYKSFDAKLPPQTQFLITPSITFALLS